jgi:hypothetical protein
MIYKIGSAKKAIAKTKQKGFKTPLRQSRHMHLRNAINGLLYLYTMKLI